MAEMIKEDWTYIGVRIWNVNDRSTKLTHCWVDAQEIQHGFGKLRITARPGAVFSLPVERKDDGVTVRFGEGEYLRMVPNSERAAMELESRAAEATSRKAKAAKSDMDESALVKILRPLKEEYMSRNPAGRRAMIATVLEELTR